MSEKEKEKDGANRLQWWIMVSLLTIVTAGGSAWASHVNDRLSDMEKFQRETIPNILRAMIEDHAKNPHRDAVSVQTHSFVIGRLDRIETKLDSLSSSIRAR